MCFHVPFSYVSVGVEGGRVVEAMLSTPILALQEGGSSGSRGAGEPWSWYAQHGLRGNKSTKCAGENTNGNP